MVVVFCQKTLRCVILSCGWQFFYGPIQLGRIITQEHRWAVMDQWYTLPFFAWVIVWGVYMFRKSPKNLPHDAALQGKYIWAIMTSSLLSYCLALIHDVGFDMALGIHILLAVGIGVLVYLSHKTAGTSFALGMACISCSVFVILKLLDHELPGFHPVFNIVSGHFLSKIGDVCQIHFTAMFFHECIKAKSIKTQ